MIQYPQHETYRGSTVGRPTLKLSLEHDGHAGVTQDKLHCISSHRKWEVRNENRATFLARAFLAGKPYRSVEAKVKDQSRFDSYILPRLLKLVAKYAEKGQDASKEAVRAWLDA